MECGYAANGNERVVFGTCGVHECGQNVVNMKVNTNLSGSIVVPLSPIGRGFEMNEPDNQPTLIANGEREAPVCYHQVTRYSMF